MRIDFLVLGEGEPCSVSSDEIDNIIERTRDFLSGITDRDAFDDGIATVLPCQRGLVCRRQTLDRRVCMPPVEGQHFLMSFFFA